MYAYKITRGDAVAIVAVSKDRDKLRKKLHDDVVTFIEEVYSQDENDDYLDWLMPVDENPDFWSDEDEEYPTSFKVFKVEEI